MQWRDRRLISLLTAGDPGARTELLEKVYPRMYSYLYHLSGSRERAGDLAQETALRIWRALPQLEIRSHASLVSWVHTVAHRVYLDSRREGINPAHVLVDPAELPARDSDPAEETVSRAASHAILAAVSRLPEHYRDTVVLRFMQGLRYREVADVLGIPTGTVRSRLAKALELLREDLLREGGEP